MKILFFFEQVDKIDIDKLLYLKWIEKVEAHYSIIVKQLRIILCSDSFLLNLNQQYLGHNTYTDIITFPYNDTGNAIEGELYISLDRVKENAENNGVTHPEELDRVIIHGLLHLIGYNDETQAQKIEMTRQEDYCLTLRPL